MVLNQLLFSRELRECMNVIVVSFNSTSNEKEKKSDMRIRKGFQDIVLFALLIDDDIISACARSGIDFRGLV